MKKNIQTKVAETILQQPQEVTLGGQTYSVAPPSIGTLILVSEKISQLPELELDSNNRFSSSLKNAKDMRKLAEIFATLILGAKRVNEKPHPFSRRTNLERLTQNILEEVSPKELNEGVTGILLTMQVGDFFVLTTFLQEINLTKPKKVESETIASGQ